jgi:hypothetical protein
MHSLAAHFELFLRSREEAGEDGVSGLFLADRPPTGVKKLERLKNLFQTGGEVDGTGEFKPRGRFPHIHLFGFTTDNASNLLSLVDIMVGAFRYCITHLLQSTAG